MIKQIFLFILAFISISNFAFADDYSELIAYRDSLKQQIDAVDSEIARCEKSMKGWKTATIVGSVGTVASGIGIIAQQQQIKENKKVLQNLSAEEKEIDATLKFQKVTQWNSF